MDQYIAAWEWIRDAASTSYPRCREVEASIWGQAADFADQMGVKLNEVAAMAEASRDRLQEAVTEADGEVVENFQRLSEGLQQRQMLLQAPIVLAVTPDVTKKSESLRHLETVLSAKCEVAWAR